MLTPIRSLFVGLTLCALSHAVTSVAPAADLDARWQIFRKHYPFHVQHIAVATDPRGSVVVVSEPPPHVAAQKVANLIQSERYLIKQHKIGYDGWVRDIVLDLPPLTPDQLKERLAELASYLHGTAYQAFYLNLDHLDDTKPAKPINVQLGADDLYRWLFKDKRLLVPALGGNAKTPAELLSSEATGVFHADPHGLIILALPKKKPIDSDPSIWRRWLLDGDLVLGAIDGPTTLMLVARERQINIDILPPLRVDEVFRLAAANDRELGQSYERTHPLAGPVKGDWDWAPIYLSAELIDTEFGSLLNITDQLLKSWSQNGRTTYVNFSYPVPPTWAFDKPLSELLPGGGLTFNWNTTGVGHIADFDDLHARVFAVHKTGSLPVTYIPEGARPSKGKKRTEDGVVGDSVAGYEEAAYSFFSGQNNVHLARVVQYTALYQLFKAFRVTADTQVPRALPAGATDSLREALLKALKAIHEAAPERIRDIAKAGTDRLCDLKGDALRDKLGDTVGTKRILMELAAVRHVTQMHSTLDALAKEYGEDALGDLATVATQSSLDDETRKRLETIYRQLGEDPTENDFLDLPKADRKLLTLLQTRRALNGTALQALSRIDDLKDVYAKAFADVRKTTSIRTPSLVLSRDSGNKLAIGGHNLDTTVGRFVIDKRATRGAPTRTTEEGTNVVLFRVHPDDARALGRVWRRVARIRDPDLQLRVLRDTLRAAETLPADLDARLGVGGGGGRIPPGGVALGSGSAEPPPEFRLPEGMREHAVVVTNRRSVTKDGRVFEDAQTMAGLRDAIEAQVKASGRRGSDEYLVLIDRNSNLTDQQINAMGATLRARNPEGPRLRFIRGSSRVLPTDLKYAASVVTEHALQDDSGQFGHAYLVSVPRPKTKSARFTLSLQRSIEGLRSRLEDHFRKLPESTREIDLDKIDGLKGVRYKLEVSTEDLLDVLFTDVQPRGASRDQALADSGSERMPSVLRSSARLSPVFSGRK